MANYDWNKIKTEYITTSISYRKLCEKYNISFTALVTRAGKEKWVEERKNHNNKIVSNTVRKVENKAIDYKSTLYDLAYKVAKQLNDMTEHNSIEALASMGIKPRDITGAIKDLGDALHVKSDSDMKEQEARIEKLRKEVEDENKGNKTIQVVISGGAEDYSE